METLFIIGTVFLAISIVTTIGAIVLAQRLKSAETEDYLEEFYDETGK